MTAGTEPLTERPAWKALKAHYTLGPPSESSLPMLAPRTINRWNAPPKVRFATDSLLEEDGFEPSVPLEEAGRLCRTGGSKIDSNGTEGIHSSPGLATHTSSEFPPGAIVKRG